MAERLSPHFTNLILERRGRGQSGDSSRHSLEREVEDVLALLKLGDQSTEVLLARPCRALSESLPNARLRVLAGQGHVAHVTAPDLLAREVHAFLRG